MTPTTPAIMIPGSWGARNASLAAMITAILTGAQYW
jgi:hypothetical protein